MREASIDAPLSQWNYYQQSRCIAKEKYERKKIDTTEFAVCRDTEHA
jgi:hypothetical protein